MAKSTEEGGGTEATTLVYPKKSAWDELVTAKETAKKRAASANGTFSKVMTRLVEEEHMDRRAARLVAALNAIEDPEDLHVTFHHLMHGIKSLKLDERAMAAPDMFAIPTPSTTAAGVKSAKQKGSKKKPDDETNVTRIGDAARKVAEEAGGAQAGA